MSPELRSRVSDIPGFFLMEVLVLVLVFISFSLVVVGWYSKFSSMKMDILKRGQAIFIASNALESIRMSGVIPDYIACAQGFTCVVSVKQDALSEATNLNNFAEIAVSVDFSDRLDPVCFVTGLMLEGQLKGTVGDSSKEVFSELDSEHDSSYLVDISE